MKPSCLKFPCGVSGTSACCNAEIQSSDICADCGEHCEDACEDCDEFDDGEDIEMDPVERELERSKFHFYKSI